MTIMSDIIAQRTILLIADFSSIIGCSLVLIGFWRLKLLRNHITKIISLFCATSLFKDVISTIITLLYKPDQTESGFPCYLHAIVITFGSLALWLWTLMLSFSIYNLIVRREPEPERFEKFYFCLCYGLPLISTIVMLSTHIIQPVGGWCWIGDNYDGYRFGLFYGPFFFIWGTSAILVGLTSKYTYSVIRSSVSDNKDKHMTYQFKLINYIVVFLVCWVFAIVNRILNGLNQFPTVPNVLHTYFSVSHGFYASITFIYNNPLMWRYFGAKFLLIFSKFGLFVQAQQRLELNKNNNNPSPIMRSKNALDNGADSSVVELPCLSKADSLSLDAENNIETPKENENQNHHHHHHHHHHHNHYNNNNNNNNINNKNDMI
nr:cAMP receptor subtype 2 [Dictyostelium discoideum]